MEPDPVAAAASAASVKQPQVSKQPPSHEGSHDTSGANQSTADLARTFKSRRARSRSASATQTAPKPQARSVAEPAAGAVAENAGAVTEAQSEQPTGTNPPTVQTVAEQVSPVDPGEPLPIEGAELSPEEIEAQAADTAADGAEPTWRSRLPAELVEALDDAKLGKGLQKVLGRLHRVIDERDAERNRRIELERNRSEQNGQPRADDPNQDEGQAQAQPEVLGWHPAIRTLDDQLVKLKAAVKWADDNPDGGEYRDAKGQMVAVGADELRNSRHQWQDHILQLTSRREAKLVHIEAQDEVARGQHHVEALKVYPWLAKKDSAEFQEALQVLREHPGLPRRPDFELVLGDVVMGRMARTARGATRLAKVNGTSPHRPALTPAPVVTLPTSAVPSIRSGQAQLQQAEKQFAASGNYRDLKEMFVAKRRQQT